MRPESSPARRTGVSRLRGRAGFTLVELMIASAIIAIIASMATVKYRSAIRVARVSKAQRELRIIAQAIDMYRLNHGYRSPATLYEVGFGGKLDPWGSPYLYLNFEQGTGTGAEFVLVNGLIDPQAVLNWDPDTGKPSQRPADPPADAEDVEDLKRKDRFLFPLNTDYDLFSVGMNRVGAATVADALSLDDVIRANDGEFYGLAGNY